MIHNGKTGELHDICKSCLARAEPTNQDCKDCETDMREEYADYPGDCRGEMCEDE